MSGANEYKRGQLIPLQDVNLGVTGGVVNESLIIHTEDGAPAPFATDRQGRQIISPLSGPFPVEAIAETETSSQFLSTTITGATILITYPTNPQLPNSSSFKLRTLFIVNELSLNLWLSFDGVNNHIPIHQNPNAGLMEIMELGTSGRHISTGIWIKLASVGVGTNFCYISAMY